jgi:hypothetical protein
MVMRGFVGFFAGALAVLTVHQSLLWLLHAIGLSPWSSYSLQPTSPWGVPQLWSAAFWGGLWGIVLVVLLARLDLHGARYWIGAVIAGGLLPTLVGAVLMAIGHAFSIGRACWLQALMVALCVNAVWGLTTMLAARLLLR